MATVNTLDKVGSLSPSALRHDVVSRLLRAIFQGQLPAGTHLVVQKLAKQMEVSPTPIREALVELESVGLVRFVHNCGVLVKPFGPDQLREIYHVRRILEVEAMRCVCGRLDPALLETFKREMEELSTSKHENGSEWSDRTMAIDQRLHERIASGCGNTRLADEIRRYDMLIQEIREIVGNHRQAQERALKEHLPIISALLVLDAEKAAAAMSRHIESTAKSVEAAMFPEPWGRQPPPGSVDAADIGSRRDYATFS